MRHLQSWARRQWSHARGSGDWWLGWAEEQAAQGSGHWTGSDGTTKVESRAREEIKAREVMEGI